MQNQNLNIEPLYRTNVILWAGCLLSQFGLLAAIFFAKRSLFSFDFRLPLLGSQPLVVLVIGMIALLNFALSFYIKSQMTRQAIADQKPEGIQTAAILGYALCESISILGLVLAFAFDYAFFFVFFGVAIFGFILHFPKRDNFHAAVYKK